MSVGSVLEVDEPVAGQPIAIEGKVPAEQPHIAEEDRSEPESVVLFEVDRCCGELVRLVGFDASERVRGVGPPPGDATVFDGARWFAEVIAHEFDHRFDRAAESIGAGAVGADAERADMGHVGPSPRALELGVRDGHIHIRNQGRSWRRRWCRGRWRSGRWGATERGLRCRCWCRGDGH